MRKVDPKRKCRNSQRNQPSHVAFRHKQSEKQKPIGSIRRIVGANMNASSMLLSRQGHYLLQIGMILIFYSSFDGFAIPSFSSPRFGFSVHTLSALQAIFL